jgi:hypothetical protein
MCTVKKTKRIIFSLLTLFILHKTYQMFNKFCICTALTCPQTPDYR